MVLPVAPLRPSVASRIKKGLPRLTAAQKVELCESIYNRKQGRTERIKLEEMISGHMRQQGLDPRQAPSSTVHTWYVKFTTLRKENVSREDIISHFEHKKKISASFQRTFKAWVDKRALLGQSIDSKVLKDYVKLHCKASEETIRRAVKSVLDTFDLQMAETRDRERLQQQKGDAQPFVIEAVNKEKLHWQTKVQAMKNEHNRTVRQLTMDLEYVRNLLDQAKKEIALTKRKATSSLDNPNRKKARN
jgi:hypothetical protein